MVCPTLEDLWDVTHRRDRQVTSRSPTTAKADDCTDSRGDDRPGSTNERNAHLQAAITTGASASQFHLCQSAVMLIWLR